MLPRVVAFQLATLISLAAAASGQAGTTAKLIGGGEVSIVRDAEVWRVTVTGPGAGLASLCLADDSRVRILHASAAVGEGVYERSAEAWALKSDFEFALRDTPEGPPPASERHDYLKTKGWVANADNTGTRPREFVIRAAESPALLGVTFLTTSEPMAVSYWPEVMDDDCRAMKVAQGFLPSTARFRPERWHPLK
jgi:hypothetical protein